MLKNQGLRGQAAVKSRGACYSVPLLNKKEDYYVYDFEQRSGTGV